MLLLSRILLILLLSVGIGLPSTAQKSKSKKSSAKKTASKKAATKKSSKSKKTKAKSKSKQKTSTATESPAKPITSKPVSDTTKPDVVVIYAAFKPSLRNAAKLNFTAATPFADTSKIVLAYKVPSQNLFFSYQPVPLKPLALFVDSSFNWQQHQYVKLGYGSYNTIYAEAGMNFGDGIQKKTNIYAFHTSAKGSLPFQQSGRTKVEATGEYKVNEQHDVTGKVYYHNHALYNYGYQPSTLIFSKTDLRKQYHSIGAEASYGRKLPNEFGLTYQPSLSINYFTDNRKAGEFNIVAKAPVSKQLSSKIKLDVAVVADVTAFKSDSSKISNNLIYVSAGVNYIAKNFTLQAGLQPSWDNGATKLLPNIKLLTKLKDERFILEAGWKGYFIKNNYNSLASFNPFMAQPTALFNTQVNDIYAGFKGSAGKHFTYNAALSFLQMSNMPVFVNDLADGKTFLQLNEPNVQAMKIHAEVGYLMQENFSVLAAANIYQFTKSANEKVYGVIPFEITGTLRWKMLKDLQLKADVFMWDGPAYRTKTLGTEKLSAAVDFSMGAEYTLLPKVNLWLQFNNLLNNKYQRWNQYEVLGLTVIGGIVYSFK